MDYKQALAAIDHEKLGRSTLEGEIDAIESLFNISLPEDYRLFLSECGFLLVEGHMIKGIYKKSDGELDSFGPSVNDSTRARKMLSKKLGRENFIIIEEGDGGGYVILNDKKHNGDSVENWERDGTFYLLRTWKSFEEFITDTINSIPAGNG